MLITVSIKPKKTTAFFREAIGGRTMTAKQHQTDRILDGYRKKTDTRAAETPSPKVTENGEKGRRSALSAAVILALGVMIVMGLWRGPALSQQTTTEAPAATEAEAAAPEAQSPPGASAVPEPSAPVPAIREIPNVLIIVSGEESLAPLLRSNLSAIIARSGLREVRLAEIPRLREKIQIGRVPVSAYSIRELVPRDKADIIVLAQSQIAGRSLLEFYGQTQELITATFTVEAVDLASGAVLDAQAAGTVDYTVLNMVENVKAAVGEAAGEMGGQISRYWQDKQGK